VHRTPIFMAFSAIINFDTVSCEHFLLVLCPFYIRFFSFQSRNPGIAPCQYRDFGIGKWAGIPRFRDPGIENCASSCIFFPTTLACDCMSFSCLNLIFYFICIMPIPLHIVRYTEFLYVLTCW